MTNNQIANPNEDPNQAQPEMSSELTDNELGSVSGGFSGGDILKRIAEPVVDAGKEVVDFVSNKIDEIKHPHL